jgi:undecaprenyl diphosphate synthase
MSTTAPSRPRTARYLAIITDGNRRWAQARGLPATAGHEAGANTLKNRLRDATELGIQELAVYAFSTENWSRPKEEVQSLISMLAQRITSETPDLHQQGVRMRFIGHHENVPEQLAKQMRWAEKLTDANHAMTLFVAINYGGRAEILDAAVRLVRERLLRSGSGEASIADLMPSEEEFRRCLYAPEMHDPDLIIRAGGEQRLSNYLLWQSAYSELVFREELWPDFTRAALQESLAQYSARQRRFGGR